MLEVLPIYLLNSLFYAVLIFSVSAGLNLVFGVSRIVNLAHGHFYMLGAFTSAYIILRIGDLVPIPLLYFLPLSTIPIMLLLGVASEMGLLRPIYKHAMEFQLLITFGLLLIIEDMAHIIFGVHPLNPSKPYYILGTTTIGAYPYPNYYFIVIGIGIAIAIVLWVILYKTKFGVITRACSLDREMSSALGVNVKSVITKVFTMSTIIAGLAAAFMVPGMLACHGMGTDALIIAFMVITIGGLGSLKGAFIGAMIAGLIRSFGVAYFPEIELAVLYLVAATVLIIRPTGLFGR